MKRCVPEVRLCSCFGCKLSQTFNSISDCLLLLSQLRYRCFKALTAFYAVHVKYHLHAFLDFLQVKLEFPACKSHCSSGTDECFNRPRTGHCHAKNCRVLNNSGSPSSEDSYVELVSWDGELAVTERKKAVAQSRTRPLSSHIRKSLARAARELPEATVPYEFSQRACHAPARVSGIVELLSFTV
ncbi:uncharacterized protein LOC112349925 [Selaginella moellendorffii]|uniref:uncharacterized protein LOC112349925 n=1 Tax=Selaginella moellendorffii TaxID=88036 RepID=UPI000D1CC586|nr:uncharacterized protein LOC112349925 [Selaginella moellendorffii]|eukprot:XP_024540986.1 uncharacterized protein LOC112349925 [Selaginella moellendorffii]